MAKDKKHQSFWQFWQEKRVLKFTIFRDYLTYNNINNTGYWQISGKNYNFFSVRQPQNVLTFQEERSIGTIMASSVIYEYSCQECNASYSDVTRRKLMYQGLSPRRTHFKILMKHTRKKITESIIFKFKTNGKLCSITFAMLTLCCYFNFCSCSFS